jgi:phospholipid/cholesterol/gamma-HCH transport system substrate-binding protein
METRARYVLIGTFVLTAIAGVFGFVYWLHSSGGLTSRSSYLVRFERSVSGLQAGSAVLFNGMRVGEVTALNVEPSNPRQVLATVVVDRTTPVRADTQVDIEVQGLMGSPSVALFGGSADASPVESRNGEIPVLVANPTAGQDMMQAARATLKNLDAILVDNADPLKSAIANINQFFGTLARNSQRFDDILEGLQRMTGASTKAPPRIYDLRAPSKFPAIENRPEGQLLVADPTAAIALDTQKILIQSDGSETASFPEAQWSDTIPKLVQARIVQGFENAGYMGVSRPLDNFVTDYQLLTDIRHFRIVSAPQATAQVELSAKLVDSTGHIIDGQTFRAETPVSEMNASAIAAALDNTFKKSATDLVVWTMERLTGRSRPH